MSDMIRLAGISKRFDSTLALAPTHLEVVRGQTTVLVGPSGSGKSTLLRLIIGLLTPDTGTIRFDREPVTADNIATLRRRMGYVIQEGGLFPHLTAKQNVVLMARHIGRDDRYIAERLAELLELTHLDAEQLERYPLQLSGGQRQRVSLMRALFLDPEVLLLDEPLGALDAVTRAALQAELKDIFARLRKTVVMVTHDLAEASFFADQMVLMDRGAVLQCGPPPEVIRTPEHEEVRRLIDAYRQSVSAFTEYNGS